MTIYLELFFEFFKIGLFTFGGGLAMIPLVKDVCISKGWLDIDTFTNFIGVCESTPGPIAINMATYIGSSVTSGNILGSIVATLGVVLPSFIIILLIASLINGLTNNKYFKNFIKGVSPVVTGLILSTGLIIMIKAFGYVSIEQIEPNYISIICFALIVLVYFGYKLISKKKLSSITLIIISVFLGIGVSLLFGNLTN